MKPTQDFTAQNLFWMKGRKTPESIKKQAPLEKEGWLKLAGETEEEIALGAFRFRGIFASDASGKPALSTFSAADSLVLRKINDNIRRAYGIRQTQRSQAVQLARTALAEWTPKGIVSLDLKSCFESITPRAVTEKLRRDAKVSSQTIHLLDLFLTQAKRFGTNQYSRGLPRGILVSSTLAELYLRELDEQISLMEGVYLYIRYVDDILVLASRPSQSLFGEISEVIRGQGLALNAAKSKILDAGCRCAFECIHATGHCPCNPKCQCQRTGDNLEYIDYLGYRLIFPTGKDIEKKQNCYAMIAKAKAAKTKMRISRAILHFKKTHDFSLLVDCLKYLTSNVTIDTSIRRSRLSSGIAYTYDQYLEPPKPHRFSDCSIDSLDVFLRTKLRKLGVSGPLTYMQRRAVMRHSFAFGKLHKHRASFSKMRAREIKECWKI